MISTKNLMSTLATDYKFRVLLAQALFGDPQALLLDEPTNHLDLESIHWLEDFLYGYEGTLIRHFSRSSFPQLSLHAHCRHRLRHDHYLPGQLRRYGRA